MVRDDVIQPCFKPASLFCIPSAPNTFNSAPNLADSLYSQVNIFRIERGEEGSDSRVGSGAFAQLAQDVGVDEVHQFCRKLKSSSYPTSGMLSSASLNVRRAG